MGHWIRTPAELDALAVSLRGAGAIAIDTEADSLHHYPGKLCLVQIADDRGHAHLVDPLALPALFPLGPCCADPRIVKVLHAARSEEHTSELQSPCNLVCRLLLEKKKKKTVH